MAGLGEMAGLLADPVRLRFVLALMDGRAWTAGELAQAAGTSAQNASNHLARLLAGGMVVPRPAGRHRYFRLASPEVARAVEALAAAAESLPQRRCTTPAPLREARCCYDHLAGRLGVALWERLQGEGDPAVTARQWIAALGGLPVERGDWRLCLDWSERRDHLAGPLAAHLLSTFLAAGLLVRGEVPRSLTVTPAGRRWFAGHVEMAA